MSSLLARRKAMYLTTPSELRKRENRLRPIELSRASWMPTSCSDFTERAYSTAGGERTTAEDRDQVGVDGQGGLDVRRARRKLRSRSRRWLLYPVLAVLPLPRSAAAMRPCGKLWTPTPTRCRVS